MSRFQLSLNVSDLEAAIAYYSGIFGVEPTKRRPGYANFALSNPPMKLILEENATAGGTINHMGIEMADTEAVKAARADISQRLPIASDEDGEVCCFAKQDKFWLEPGPDGERFEVYTVLEDAEERGGKPLPVTTSGTAGTETACCA